MKISERLTIRYWFCLYLSQTCVLALAIQPSQYDRNGNGFRSTVNDKLDLIGSVNEASGIDKGITHDGGEFDSKNRLNSFQSVLNNYSALLSRLGESKDSTDKSIFGPNVQSGTRILHTGLLTRLYEPASTAEQYIDPIMYVIEKQNLNSKNINGGMDRKHRKKRSIKRRRQERGVRSSVADRIAHGFGKRGGELLFPLDENETGDLRRGQNDAMSDDKINEVFDELLKMFRDYNFQDQEMNYSGYNNRDGKDRPLSSILNQILEDVRRDEAYKGPLESRTYNEQLY